MPSLRWLKEREHDYEARIRLSSFFLPMIELAFFWFWDVHGVNMVAETSGLKIKKGMLIKSDWGKRKIHS